MIKHKKSTNWQVIRKLDLDVIILWPMIVLGWSSLSVFIMGLHYGSSLWVQLGVSYWATFLNWISKPVLGIVLCVVWFIGLFNSTQFIFVNSYIGFRNTRKSSMPPWHHSISDQWHIKQASTLLSYTKHKQVPTGEETKGKKTLCIYM